MTRQHTHIGAFELSVADVTDNLTAGCKPCELQAEMNARAAASLDAVDNSQTPSGMTWSGPIAFEGQMTGDGREIAPNALRFDQLPIPLRYSKEDNGAHMGAVVVGRVLSVERRPDGMIWGHGDYMDTDIAREAAAELEFAPGVSIDLDDISFEVRVNPEVANMGSETEEFDSEGRQIVGRGSSKNELMYVTDARLRGLTQVSIPAFAGAAIKLDAQDTESLAASAGEDETLEAETEEFREVSTKERKDLAKEGEAMPDGSYPIANEADLKNAIQAIGRAKNPDAVKAHIKRRAKALGAEDMIPDSWSAEALVAGAFPVAPPTEWFADPKFSGPTALVVTKEGRVYGHIAAWDTCHTAFPGQCVTPPSSPSGYAYFKTGSVYTSDDTQVSVGHLTLDTLHAKAHMSPAQTLAHYENTGRAVADVSAGEDSFGIWVAGALRPGVTEEQARTLRASPISGDWRRVSGSLELVAALAVNVPGFPVPRPQGLVASGVMQSLVASGILAQDLSQEKIEGLSDDDLAALRSLAYRERERQLEEQKAATLSKAKSLLETTPTSKVVAMAAVLKK